MTIRVCLAGATGWAGSSLARAIAQADDIVLVAAVSRSHAGHKLGEVLSEPGLTCPVYATAQEAFIQPCDIFFDYTKPTVAKTNSLAALEAGAHVIIGTSGLTELDYAELSAAADRAGLAVLAVGNFAITAVLLMKFAEIAARYIPSWEIIDYAHDDKRDAPSGTARELASRLSKISASSLTVALEDTQGMKEARGVRLNGSQVHSIRLPGYTISAEIIFGMPDQRLSIRHDSGSSALPYVDGALLAIRKVNALKGLHRGLDSILDLS
jgi:4-hydroxy-tetrahydrodipicolinate reductase